MLDLGTHSVRRPAGESALGAGVGELAQVRGGRLARRHDLLRVFIAQFLEREGAACGDGDGLAEPLFREFPHQHGTTAQVVVVVGKAPHPRLLDGAAMPHGSQGVQDRLGQARVHERAARCCHPDA